MRNVERNGGRPGILRRNDVRRRFDRAAARFDDVDFVHRHAAKGLFARMSPMLVEARTILDAGTATGTGGRELANLYRGSRIICLDASMNMLARARSRAPWFARLAGVSRLWELQADAMALPLQSGTVDLVFANMLLPWIDDIGAFFGEVARVLRKDGLFVFSSLGPDSLLELRRAWASIDEGEHVNTFIDMHDVGDALLYSGLREPVLDTDYLTVTYRDADALIGDLTRTGARNSLERRRASVTGKGRIENMKHALNAFCRNGELPCRLEIVFGHAWGGGPRPSPGEFRVDAARIGRRSR